MIVSQLPPDAEPLTESGFFASATDLTRFGIQFRLYREYDNRTSVMNVCDIEAPEEHPTSWGEPERWVHKIRPFLPNGKVSAATARAYAEVIVLAATLADVFNEGMADAIERAKAARAERDKQEAARREEREREAAKWREQRRIEREERIRLEAERAKIREARAKWLYEQLRWMIDHQIRLTRDGKRSTVFGTIDVVAEPWKRTRRNPETGESEEYITYGHVRMYITTERGKSLDITLADINCLDVKYDGEKRFQNLYKAGMESAETTTTS